MEYMMLHFADLSFDERHAFQANNSKNSILRQLPKGSDATKYREFCDLLDDKYASYTRFIEDYKRDAMVISKDEDFDSFVEFCGI